MSTHLPPGNYFIELAFRRQVNEETLARALTAMGFTSIEFDKNEDVAVGAIASATTSATTLASRTLSSTAASTSLSTAPVATLAVSAADRQKLTELATKGADIASRFVEVKAERNKNPSASYRFGFDVATGFCQGMSLPGPGQDAIRVLVSKLDSSSATIAGFNAGQLLQHNITKGVVKTTPVPAPIAASTATVATTATTAAVKPPIAASTATVATAATTAAVKPPIPASTATTATTATTAAVRPPTTSAPISAQAAAPTPASASTNNFASRERVPDPIAEQEEADYRRTVAEAEAQAAKTVPQGQDEPPARTYGDTSVTKADPAAGLLRKLSEDMSQSMIVPVPDRWKRWVEWGSPFATSAAYLTNVSGEEELSITRFRFVAKLTKTLAPQNLPEMSWVFIRRLSLDPFKDLTFQLTPFKLQRGGLYEFRFFSRQKSNPTKESVKETLAKMGFSPMKLNLLKKNMRIPRRGNVSVCMWLGIGRWSAPNSVVTTEDPFFFESLKEVQP